MITIENKTVEVAQGSYCWGGLITRQYVDIISPPEIIKHQELKPLVVSPGVKLKIKFKRKPLRNSLNASIWFSNDEIENIPLNDNSLLVPKEKFLFLHLTSKLVIILLSL